MITPTVGRVVWYHPLPRSTIIHAALIVHVHNQRLVNLAAFGSNGIGYGVTSVTLLQDDDPAPEFHHASWMPYQVGQAAKTEAAEAALAARR
jgi:hypothetical protein